MDQTQEIGTSNGTTHLSIGGDVTLGKGVAVDGGNGVRISATQCPIEAARDYAANPEFRTAFDAALQEQLGLLDEQIEKLDAEHDARLQDMIATRALLEKRIGITPRQSGVGLRPGDKVIVTGQTATRLNHIRVIGSHEEVFGGTKRKARRATKRIAKAAKPRRVAKARATAKASELGQYVQAAERAKLEALALKTIGGTEGGVGSKALGKVLGYRAGAVCAPLIEAKKVRMRGRNAGAKYSLVQR